MSGRNTGTSAHFLGGGDKPLHVGRSGRMQMQERNEDLLLLPAREAPAIIPILSCLQGGYYSIYFNSSGLLHFFRAGQREKESQFRAVGGMRSEACSGSSRLRAAVLGAVT